MSCPFTTQHSRGVSLHIYVYLSEGNGRNATQRPCVSLLCFLAFKVAELYIVEDKPITEELSFTPSDFIPSCNVI